MQPIHPVQTLDDADTFAPGVNQIADAVSATDHQQCSGRGIANIMVHANPALCQPFSQFGLKGGWPAIPL
jgi:hypothetical protein